MIHKKLANTIKLWIKRWIIYPTRFWLDLLTHRIRHRGRQPTRFLLVSDGRSVTNEAQFDPFRFSHSSKLVSRLGVVVQNVSLQKALAFEQRELAKFDVVGLKLFFLTPIEEVDEIVRSLGQRLSVGAKLVFFDGDDDVGILWPSILRSVDLYVKNQLFADRVSYSRSTVGKNNLTEYAATQHGASFEDDPIPRSKTIDEKEHLEKLFLGWNLGSSRFIEKTAKLVGPIRTFQKDLDVSCRVGITPGAWTTGLRKPALEQLEQLSTRFRVVASAERVPMAHYLDEMERSRICVSPFGYGEICFRDFEAAIYGCLLIKPDMSHLETQPNIYSPGQTYIPVRWDFSDLQEKCVYYLEHEDERARIAARAREVLLEFIAQGRFVEILGDMLERLQLAK
jgi:hypothetical protein